MYKIEDHVPMPTEPESGRPAKYPFRAMKIGQSFFANVPDVNTTQWTKRTGYKFRVRHTTENGVTGVRCWRIS